VLGGFGGVGPAALAVEAQKAATAAAEAMPNDPDPLGTLARALWAQAQDEAQASQQGRQGKKHPEALLVGAEQACVKSLNKGKQDLNWNVWATLAQVSFHLGKHAQAEQAETRARAIHPGVELPDFRELRGAGAEAEEESADESAAAAEKGRGEKAAAADGGAGDATADVDADDLDEF
jgi:hypothetical protein